MCKKCLIGIPVGSGAERQRGRDYTMLTMLIAHNQSYKILVVHYESKHPKDPVPSEESFATKA